MLPDDVRSRCHLHLASFIEPTTIGQLGVIAHSWMEDVPAFLRTMDVMLALSTNETFSQAIVQGMLSGLPVIATGIPVYVEKLDGGEGIVTHTTEEIRDAMVALAGDPAKRHEMGAKGRETAMARYVWDTDRFLREHLLPRR
jgi:glycosyltransferase involved in cell wall biosynthesis